ncbi:MAG: PKD domain-containing protein [Candidatus Thermoplasmatota archaeon]|nr:PKD domain-containing protein [Candidatus Thermoplasmatota archaeon]
MKKSIILTIITIFTISASVSPAGSLSLLRNCDSGSIELICGFDKEPPFADFNCLVYGRFVIFNASSSFDPDGVIIEYYWDFGDFTGGDGKIINHTYLTCGIYNVTLSIEDNDGFIDKTSKNVSISDVEKPQIFNEQVSPALQQAGGYINLSANAEDNNGLKDVRVVIQYPNLSKENLSILSNNNGECYYCNQTYDIVGRYAFHFWAIDFCGNIAKSKLINIFYITESLAAEANGPYRGLINKPIQFSGSASGGKPPYSYYWDFCDGGISTFQNPKHTYLNEGIYTAILIVNDSLGYKATDLAMVTIEIPDSTPPFVKIIQPENGIYVRNNKIMGFLSPIALGFIEIGSIATDEESGVAYLELYIDNQLRENFTGESFVWTWFEMSFSMHFLKVIAYDNAGNAAEDAILIWKFF